MNLDFSLLCVLLGLVAAPTSAQATARGRNAALVIGVLTQEGTERSRRNDATPSARGITLGAEEAALTARLFGKRVVVVNAFVSPSADPLVAARRQFGNRRLAAVFVTALDLVDAGARFAAANHTLFLNTFSRTPSTVPVCSDYYLAIAPDSLAMAHVAARLGSQGDSISDSTAHLPRGSGRHNAAVLWHYSLQRFGARELNDRYQSLEKSRMTGDAWASWVGVKILSEAALRTGSVESRRLLGYLQSAEFDGHKGWPLSFREADHTLRQPLYILDSSDSTNSVLAELPLKERSGNESAARALDELNPPPVNSACRWSK